jgi:hypothetical protein
LSASAQDDQEIRRQVTRDGATGSRCGTSTEPTPPWSSIRRPASPGRRSITYALHDANAGNSRSGRLAAINRAKVGLESYSIISETQGLPYVTRSPPIAMASVYADITATPYVTADKLKAAPPARRRTSPNQAHLCADGGRACGWDRGTGVPGLFPPALMPQTVRQTSANSNAASGW